MGIKSNPPESTVGSLDTFNRYRRLLFGIAYRMLGTVSDAEDMVQETFLRWHQAPQTQVRSAKNYLATTIVRLCIDRLRSAQVRREQYVGPWLPEPVLTQQDPAERVELADSLSMAFLVMLERLSPLERAVFLLREVFEYEYPEIARIVDKSPENCRQILRRSRQHLSTERPRFSVAPQQQEQIVAQFLSAASQGNLQQLLTLLAPDVTFRSDGGGVVPAALKPMQGAMKVAKFLLAIQCKFPPTIGADLAKINGQPGLILRVGSDIHSAIAFKIAAGYIQEIYNIRNPDKLKHLKHSAEDRDRRSTSA